MRVQLGKGAADPTGTSHGTDGSFEVVDNEGNRRFAVGSHGDVEM